MIWIATVAGRLKNDFRYSSALCYNCFPFPSISRYRKDELMQLSFNIIEQREKFSNFPLSKLYNLSSMPTELKDAHRQNDLAIEQCYRDQPFSNDNERLEYLFSLYERMIEIEQSQNTLFADEVRKKRKRRVNA